MSMEEEFWSEFRFASEGELEEFCEALEAGRMDDADAIVMAGYERLKEK